MKSIRYRAPNVGAYATLIRDCEETIHLFRFAHTGMAPRRLTDLEVGNLAAELRWIARRINEKHAIAEHIARFFDERAKAMEWAA